MSLINDALKRAKQAQQQVPPSMAPGLQLRPVDPSLQSGRRFGLMLPSLAVGIIALGLFFAWGRFREGSKAETAKTTATTEKQGQAGALQVSSPRSNKRAEPGLPDSSIVNPPPGTTAPALLTDPTPLPPTVQLTSASVASEKPVAPAPAPLKLQGILFDPKHPAVMIGGKMLFINDKLGDWQVVAINRESATLSHAGQTNVLSLPQ